MTAVLTAVTEQSVRAALDAVVDPELDEPVTDLGFVRSVAVSGSDVEVHLRLPTSFCAPNFAWLMVSDARDALRGVAGVGRVTVELDDHLGVPGRGHVLRWPGHGGSVPGPHRPVARPSASFSDCSWLVCQSWKVAPCGDSVSVT